MGARREQTEGFADTEPEVDRVDMRHAGPGCRHCGAPDHEAGDESCAPFYAEVLNDG